MAQQFSLIDGVLYHVQTDGCLLVAVPESLYYKLFEELMEDYFLDTYVKLR